MPLARLHSVSLIGLEALSVEVEVDVTSSEKSSLVIVGLPDTAVRESKDRVLTSVKNAGFPLGLFHCTVNLAPGDLKKEGAFYDLPIAVGLICATGRMKISSDQLSEFLIVGELSLGGDLRSVRGALAIAMLAKEKGIRKIILPFLNAQEAAIVEGVSVYGFKNLQEVIHFLENPHSVPSAEARTSVVETQQNFPVDFSDIKGQMHVKRALEIAAAGGHNMVLSGPPGCGKTLMAKALISIMPPMTLQESLEVTKIHSIAGLLPEGVDLVPHRPFRSPHHTISYAGLIGGGSSPRPGEVSLAHHGILFLDEFPEFSRSVLEVLRQPLEDRQVTISRAQGNFTFPTSIMCIAAMNPCPCGNLGHPDKVCSDTPLQVERYKGKISGPLWDRLDLHVDVPPLRYTELVEKNLGESSKNIRERVIKARNLQYKRLGGAKTNALLSPREMKYYCTLSYESLSILQTAIEHMGLSARACDRILKVSRTIADLEEKAQIEPAHVLESINLRNFSRSN